MKNGVHGKSDGDRMDGKEESLMEAALDFNVIPSSNCGCCLTADEQGGGYTCEDRSKVFTLREENVLARIRSASERARSLKREIGQLKNRSREGEEMGRFLDELAALRRERVSLEEERLAAAHERMRLLGHA